LRSGGLSLGTYADVLEGGRSGAAVKPGSAAASLLVERTTGEMQPRMPLGGPPLATAEVAILRTWIDEGARATPTSAPAKPKWEAPLPLAKPAVPAVVWKNWQAPVDRFIAAYLARQGVAEPQLAADAVFARRAYLDVWGLLPAPEELRRFLDDPRPNKRDLLAAALLADTSRYAENWISFWDDLLRNDEGVNYYSETICRWNRGKNFEAYNTGRFGQGCLLARRLVEAGARYIEVTTEYIPFRYWDSHENGHERALTMKQQIDAPVAQLILDLEERGLLNRTLVVLASEFGRDAITEGKVGKEVKDQAKTLDVMSEPKHYGMHRHFTAAGSVLMFGGGVKKGFLYGRPPRSAHAPPSKIRCRWKTCTLPYHLSRPGHRARPIFCRGETARVCDQGWQGQSDRRDVRMRPGRDRTGDAGEYHPGTPSHPEGTKPL
jgi:hypothetical protein